MNEPGSTPNRVPSHSISALVPGAVVVLLGVLFLLSNLGVLHTPIWQFWRLWPVFMIVAGVVNMRRHLTAFIWGLATALFGVGFLLDNFGLLPFHPWQLWPIFVVALGVQWLLATATGGRDREWRSDRAARRESWPRQDPAPGISVGPNQPLHMMAMFSEASSRITSSDFFRGEAFSMFGNCKIDLRPMGVPGHAVTIDASTVFGAVEIYVPSTWDVILRGFGILGVYQDETLPPVTAGGERGTLIVQGVSMLGAVTVKN